MDHVVNYIFQSNKLGNAHLDLHKYFMWCETNFPQTGFKYANSLCRILNKYLINGKSKEKIRNHSHLDIWSVLHSFYI